MQKKILIVCLGLIPFVFADLKQIGVEKKIDLKVESGNKLKSTKSTVKDMDRIVAYVNKDVITSNQVNMQVKQIFMQLNKNKGIIPSEVEVKNQILEQLIMQKIQLDLANRLGIKTTDIEITDVIKNIAKAQQLDLTQFIEKLNNEGISFDTFRQQIRTQVLIDKLKQREVDARIVVNDDEVNRVLNSEAYKNRVDYELSDIIISIPEQNQAVEVEKKQKLANQAYLELKNGVPFEEVAAKYSVAPNALNGGKIGWKSNTALPPVISDELKDLKSGDYTKVIRVPVGFFIFKINNIRKHGMPQIVRQYHVRHILIRVNETTDENEAQNKILEIKKKLDQDINQPEKLNEDFIKLAKYSEDTSSINGGDIGWVSKGDTVPAFEKAIINTPTGKISDIIRTPFGWHILEVLGVRDSNLTNDKERADIRQDIRESKGALLYTQWLRDIREMAYVKINDN